MANQLDKDYQRLLELILGTGVEKSDRTGTGTISIFGEQIRHNMQDGFPLLTTKKMAFKTMVTELLWFLRGDTNIKYLVDNGCSIWNGDAYKKYEKHCWHQWEIPIGELKSTHPKIDRVKLDKEEFINKIKTDDEFAKKWGELGPIYGKQWRDWEYYCGGGDCNVDQIQNLINDLKTNPDSRRLMVNAWNVGELNQMVLPPCHYGFQVYTRELTWDERYVILKNRTNEDPLKYSRLDNGDYDSHPKEMTTKWMNEINIPTRAISLMWNQRSVDTFLGLPFNIASYGLLLEIIAKEVNMIPDELIGNLGDVHLYSNHLEQAKEQISREPMQLPKICLDYEEGEYNKDLIDLTPDDFVLFDYQSHPSIKAPLSN